MVVAWRKARDRDVWHQVVSKATLLPPEFANEEDNCVTSVSESQLCFMLSVTFYTLDTGWASKMAKRTTTAIQIQFLILALYKFVYLLTY